MGRSTLDSVATIGEFRALRLTAWTSGQSTHSGTVGILGLWGRPPAILMWVTRVTILLILEMIQ